MKRYIIIIVWLLCCFGRVAYGQTLKETLDSLLQHPMFETTVVGIEVYDLLRDEYDIQIEFGDIGNILAYVSVGDRKRDIERLISAMSEIKRRFGRSGSGMLTQEYINPIVAEPPRKAFYAQKRSLPLEEAAGNVCTEFVMCYPPGIPILAPGELITPEIIEYIKYAKEKGCQMTGTEDINIERLNVLA